MTIMKSSETTTFTAELQEAIRNDGKSQNQIADLASITRPQLSLFMTQGKCLGLQSLNRLFETLGLTIVKKGIE